MREVSEDEFGEMRMLAGQVGIGDERIDVLRVQALGGENDFGDALTLMASAGEGTLELLLSRWLGGECTERLAQAGTRPLVIGPTPERVLNHPGARGWAAYQSGKLAGRGHVVALTATGDLPGKTLGALTMVGRWDSAVIVTRASMPLPQNERELTRSLSKVMAIGKVLVVAVPGELRAPTDVVKVREYVRSRLEGSGFPAGRCGGVSFWWLDGVSGHDEAVADPSELLVQDAPAVARGRDLMLRNGLIEFLDDVERKAIASGVKPLPTLSEDELREIEENLSKALAGVLRAAEAEYGSAVGTTDTKVRSFVIDQVLGWKPGNGFAGIWLNYVDTVRPGARAGLFERARKAADVLSIELSTPRPRQGGAANPSSDILGRLAGIAVSDRTLRLGFAMVCGVAVWLVSPGALGGLLAAVLATAGTLLGYAVAGPVVAWMRKLAPHQADATVSGREKPGLREVRIRNFNLFEHELREWLSGCIRAERIDVPARCQELRRRLAPSP